jgi:four helix bundle protein
MAQKITSHTELEVFRRSVDSAMALFEITKSFPREEMYSLTDQLRRCSRSVSGNLAEAWRKRRYPAAFVSKLSDSEAEAAETQVWIEYSVKCGYLNRNRGAELYQSYDAILRTIVGMISHPESWCFPESSK